MKNEVIKVLIIDDNEDDLVLIRHMLSRTEGCRFDVNWAEDYEPGLQTLIQDQHDICLIDYRLGTHSGLDLLKEAISRGCQVPIILLTGAGDRHVDVEAGNAGAVDYLFKSEIDSAILERSIRYSVRHARTMRALRESEERFRFQANILSQVNDAVIGIDQNEKISYWNPGAERLYGFKREGVMGRLSKDVLHYRWIKAEDERVMHESLLTVGSWRGEKIHRKSNGEEILVEASMNVTKDSNDRAIGRLVVTRDITKRRKTEEALWESYERFRMLFECSMDAILIEDDRGNYLKVNKAACELLGYSEEDLLGMNSQRLMGVERSVHGSQSESEHEKTKDLIEEISFHRPDGERCIVEFSSCEFASNLRLTIMRDATERRRLEKEIQEISEKEQRRIGQDLHDGLCQQLAGIAYMSKVLESKLSNRKVPEAKEAGEIAKLVNQSISHTRDLARGLCPVELETSDLHSALVDLASRVESMFQITCKVYEEDVGPIHDTNAAIHLYRISQEAINNAIRHGKAKNIWIRLRHEVDYSVLTLRDDGVGIMKDAFQNRGMGLRVMNYRAGIIGGNLNVKRHPQGGTMVTCIFQNVQNRDHWRKYAQENIEDERNNTHSAEAQKHSSGRSPC